MTFKMKGFSAFTKKTDEEYVPQSQRKDKEYEPQSQIDPKDIPPPSVKEDKVSMRAYYDIMPQTEIDKADVGRLEGEITGIFDNQYHEAKEDNDTKAMKRYEKQMLKLKKEIESRGAKDESGVNMSAFKKTDPPPANEEVEVDKNKEAYKSFTSRVMAANPQFEYVEDPKDILGQRGMQITDWDNPAYDDIRDKFVYNPDIDLSLIHI